MYNSKWMSNGDTALSYIFDVDRCVALGEVLSRSCKEPRVAFK
jgi:hypothetical protein